MKTKKKKKKQVDTKDRMEKCRLLDKIGAAKTNQYRRRSQNRGGQKKKTYQVQLGGEGKGRGQKQTGQYAKRQMRT